jgi:hypothetical protein
MPRMPRLSRFPENTRNGSRGVDPAQKLNSRGLRNRRTLTRPPHPRHPSVTGQADAAGELALPRSCESSAVCARLGGAAA